jgi:hypothetical protein
LSAARAKTRADFYEFYVDNVIPRMKSVTFVRALEVLTFGNGRLMIGA